jgi:hypothetical protein
MLLVRVNRRIVLRSGNRFAAAPVEPARQGDGAITGDKGIYQQLLGYTWIMIRTAESLNAVEGLYETFRRYPLHADTNACPCCHRPEQERVLHLKPLRELTADDLQMYAADAILVWGSEDDYRHFLPRIFELMISFGDPRFELHQAPVVFNKLRFANWANWPIEEQNAIRRYLVAAWKCCLRTNPDDLGLTDAEDWLSGIAQAEDDLHPYLGVWSEEPSVEAARHLAALIVEHQFVQDDARPQNFWSERKEQWAQVREWLLGDTVRHKLRAAGDGCRDERLELAMQVLRIS